jgi:DNA-binding MarR family transcriptional regulator
MNKTVTLVNLWAAYEEKHPHGSIEDFCRYHLISQRRADPAEEKKLTGGLVPLKSQALLLKIMGRIMRLQAYYSRLALEGREIGQFEEFALLNSIAQLKDPRKSEAIYATIYELSTGTDLLNRLRKKGYIAEVADKTDRRSKRVKITAAGKKVLQAALTRISMMAELVMHDIDAEDQRLCIQLLKNVEIRLSERWLTHRGKAFDEIYESVVKKPQ